MTLPVYRIAIADADALVLRFLRQCVERAGHEVAFEAASSPTLIERCRHVPPDLIVADIEMLGVDGFEAVSRLQRIKATPVIALSASCTKSSIDRAEECDAYAYLLKSVQDSCLQATIALTARRFEDLHVSRSDADDVRQALADRKKIERPRGSSCHSWAWMSRWRSAIYRNWRGIPESRWPTSRVEFCSRSRPRRFEVIKALRDRVTGPLRIGGR